MSRRTIYIRSWIIMMLFCIHEVMYANVDDTQFRQYIGLTYQPIKPLEFSATYRLDIHENISQFNKNNFDLSASYDIKKWVELSAGYRFSTSYKKDRHRLALGLSFKAKSSNKKYQFQFRSLLNFDSEYFDTDYWKVEDPSYKLRLRTKVKYSPTKKLDLSVFTETSARNLSQKYKFYRMRYGGAIEYSLTKAHKFGIGYFYQHEFNIKKPSSIQTLSAEYTYKIRAKKKKK